MSLAIHTMKALPDEGGWSVGYWHEQTTFQWVPVSPQGTVVEERSLTSTVWIEICQFKETADAVRRVNALNGGIITT